MELTPDQSDELKRSLPDCVARASSLISEADVLLFSTGAGWSADSGLPTYEQTPDYANVCKPAMLRVRPRPVRQTHLKSFGRHATTVIATPPLTRASRL